MCSLDGVQLPSKMWPDHKDFNFRYDALHYPMNPKGHAQIAGTVNKVYW